MSALFPARRAAGFDELYQQHAASVYRYALAVLGNPADAEDVSQQTFLNAYRAIEQGTKPRKTENWLLTIAHNEVRRHFRARGKAVEVALDERLAHPDHPDSDENDPSLADVLRALQHLPPAQRSALVMREFEGRSYAEIAEILGVTQSALETLIFRARRGLAEQLEGAITCAEAEQAFSRRLDGRLPRREARRLKAHLKDCPVCVRFATAQKRQRSLLKVLSLMPFPIPVLFRGEPAAAAGLGATGVAAGGSAALGGTAAGAGVAGIGAGVAAKAAAVAAAAAVAGGVGYGVAVDNERSAKRATEPVAAAAETPLRAASERPLRRRALRTARQAPSHTVVPTRARPAAKKAKAQAARTAGLKRRRATPKRAPAVTQEKRQAAPDPAQRPATKPKPAKRPKRPRPVRPLDTGGAGANSAKAKVERTTKKPKPTDELQQREPPATAPAAVDSVPLRPKK